MKESSGKRPIALLDRLDEFGVGNGALRCPLADGIGFMYVSDTPWENGLKKPYPPGGEQ